MYLKLVHTFLLLEIQKYLHIFVHTYLDIYLSIELQIYKMHQFRTIVQSTDLHINIIKNKLFKIKIIKNSNSFILSFTKIIT